MSERTLSSFLLSLALLTWAPAVDAEPKPMTATERAKLVREIAAFGVYESRSATGGYSSTFVCDPKKGRCHITEGWIGRDNIQRGKVYDFPFVAAEWVRAQYDKGEDWRKMPAMLRAVGKPYALHYHYVAPPPGQHYCGSVIEPGETCVSGGLEPDGPLP